jgi:penicillin-binding protein 2
MPEQISLADTLTEARIFGQRILFAAGVVVLLFAALAARYFQLQVLDHDKYRTESDRNRIHVRAVPPQRGLIYDRNGVRLAENQPIFNLNVTRERAGDLNRMLKTVGGIVELSPEEISEFHKRLKHHTPFDPVPLKIDLDEEEIARLAVNRYRLPGVDVATEVLRRYPHGEMLAHVVGYVSRINEQELAELDSVDYSGTYLIGKNGIEKYYEAELHGRVGYENVETNAHGRVLRVLEYGEPERGMDLTLELDINVQRVAYEALAGQRGAVVAIDPKTGGVIAIASAPSFDPNLFVTGISFRDYAVLRDSLDRPLLNRTMQGLYPPGSTVKPMYALGGLVYGINTPESAVSDPGFYRLNGRGRRFRDWKKSGHGGAVSLRQAVAESCDVYFYDLAHRIGIDRMHDFAVRFGLGEATGVDQTSERPGVMPSTQWKRDRYKQPWYPGETLNAGIGQGYVLTTPMQLAVMTATLANRGYHVQPRLVARRGKQRVMSVTRDRIELENPEQWDVVLGAMEDVVHGPRGTASRISIGMRYRAGGKTGTAQVIGIAQNATYVASKIDKRQRDHALFIGYAPADDPRIAVAIIVENGEHGSTTAAPIARKVFDAYLLGVYPPPPPPPETPVVPEPVTPPADGAAPITPPPAPAAVLRREVAATTNAHLY